jgi:hypothetical protein
MQNFSQIWYKNLKIISYNQEKKPPFSHTKGHHSGMIQIWYFKIKHACSTFYPSKCKCEVLDKSNEKLKIIPENQEKISSHIIKEHIYIWTDESQIPLSKAWLVFYPSKCNFTILVKSVVRNLR